MYVDGRDTDKLLHKKEATEKKIHDLRAKLVEGEEDIIERRKTNNAEDKSLKDLDLSIAKSKNRSVSTPQYLYMTAFGFKIKYFYSVLQCFISNPLFYA